MKTRTLIALFSVSTVLIAFATYQLGLQRHAAVAQTTQPAATDAKIDPKTGRPVLYWHDPMVPGPRFDKPGKSPFMDMQLVPVYADESGGAGVTVSSQTTQSLGLRSGIVRKGELSTHFDAVGVVTENERATEVVQSRVTAYIEKLHVRAPQDPVRKGQTLATLYAPEWAAALEEYLGLRKAQVGAALIDAARERLRLLSIPDGVVERSERAGAAQTRFELAAPIQGVVAELGVRDGAMVSPGMTLFRITDLRSVWVVIDVPQSMGSQLRPGRAAEVQVPGIEPQSLPGRVRTVLPDVDPATRTIKARIELPNPNTQLKPGLFVQVRIKVPSTQPTLLIPQEAVIATGLRTVVIAMTEDGRFIPTDVTLGRDNGEEVEIRSGLSEGQRVVVSGQFLLDSEANLKSGLGRMGTEVTTASVPTRHFGIGVIRGMDADGITLTHEPIASLQWGAMTMPFKAPSQGLPKSLKEGMRVKFDFVQEGDDYVLQSVVPAAEGGKP